MDIYEFSKIIGILLDNAIDASKITEEKDIFVEIRNAKNGNQIATIQNSYLDKEIDIKSIFKKGFSTKKIKSGLGLWEVKQIIKRYPNVKIHTSKDEDYFSQALVMKKK